MRPVVLVPAGSCLPVAAEARVEHTEGRVAGDSHVVGGAVARVVRIATDEDLAVRRDGQVSGHVGTATEVGDGDAVAATKRRVHGPVGRQPRQTPITGPVVAGDDDLSVRLELHARQHIRVGGTQVELVDAVRAERVVQLTVRRVAGNEEVAVCLSSDDDIAVRLDLDAVDRVAAAQIGCHPSVSAERRVNRAVGVDPRQGDVPVAVDHGATDQDLVVCLEGTREALVFPR